MPDIWLPGYERWDISGAPGTPYDEIDDPKAVAHTTEGTSIDGAVSAYRAYPPQLIVDPVRRRCVQHIPLNRAGYALWNGDADDSRCYQVEIVGFASQTHLWSDATLRWLGENLARPLHEYGGVPYRVVWKGFRRDGEMPYALADSDSPLRLTQAELDSFSGWLGHQHIPGDSHWDPGGLDVGKILGYAQEIDMYDEKDRKRDNHTAWRLKSFLDVVSPTHEDPNAPEPRERVQAAIDLNSTKQRVWSFLNLREVGDRDAIKGEALPFVTAFKQLTADVAELKASVTAPVIDYARLADEVAARGVFPTAGQIADELDRRARDNDHTTGPTT
jgi:hypothetical protein